jgi:glycosyltransferase involved in cell wall biosynthesis
MGSRPGTCGVSDRVGEGMRVAILIDGLNLGGAERQALLAGTVLAGLGCRVDLLHYHPHAPDTGELGALPDGMRIALIRKDQSGLGLVRSLARHFRANQVQIVHGFKTRPTFYAALGGRLAKVPVVLGGCRGRYTEPALVRWAHRCIEPLLSGWIVNSEATISSLHASLGVDENRCFVVFNGVDRDAFASSLSKASAKQRLAIDPQSPTIAMIANLRPVKNHALFLDMASRVLIRHPAARFLIVGDGELRSALERTVATLGLEKAVRFLGHRSDIRELLAATDISILTSESEGMPNVVLEAMSAGIPVVSSLYPGVGQVFTDSREGFVVSNLTGDAFADRVCRLIEDPALGRRMGEQGRLTVSARFSTEAMGARLLDVYRNCLESAVRRPYK